MPKKKKKSSIQPKKKVHFSLSIRIASSILKDFKEHFWKHTFPVTADNENSHIRQKL